MAVRVPLRLGRLTDYVFYAHASRVFLSHPGLLRLLVCGHGGTLRGCEATLGVPAAAAAAIAAEYPFSDYSSPAVALGAVGTAHLIAATPMGLRR